MVESDPGEIGSGQTSPPSMTSFTSANEAVKPVEMACCDHCSVFCYTRASFSVSVSVSLSSAFVFVFVSLRRRHMSWLAWLGFHSFSLNALVCLGIGIKPIAQ